MGLTREFKDGLRRGTGATRSFGGTGPGRFNRCCREKERLGGLCIRGVREAGVLASRRVTPDRISGR